MFTTLKNEWDKCIAVVKAACEAVAEVSLRVGLVLKADIRPGWTGQLTAKVERVEERLRMRFKGGKAVATSAGVIFGFAPVFCLYLAIVFFGSLYLGSMISLSSVTASIAAVIGVLIFPLFGFILSSYDFLFIVIILVLCSPRPRE